MRTIRLLGVLFLFVASHLAVRATILAFVGERLDFDSPDAVKDKATWGGPTEHPLDFKAGGLGSESVMERGEIDAWVRTNPMALGSWGQPWRFAGFSVEVQGFKDGQRSCVARVFVRHSPDRKHWTTWSAMSLKTAEELEAERIVMKKNFKNSLGPFGDESRPLDQWNKAVFHCSLEVPRTTRASYEQLLEAFAKTKPPRPKFQEDAVRWILAQYPHYFENQPPFLGYVQFLFEINVGQSPRRLKSVTIGGFSLSDELMGHLTDANRAEYEGKKWSFVAP
ncbi:MAG: hypothetical protein WC661_10820 [Opitutaceae bacterium]|jgi:hypothetical protein